MGDAPTFSGGRDDQGLPPVPRRRHSPQTGQPPSPLPRTPVHATARVDSRNESQSLHKRERGPPMRRLNSLGTSPRGRLCSDKSQVHLPPNTNGAAPQHLYPFPGANAMRSVCHLPGFSYRTPVLAQVGPSGDHRHRGAASPASNGGCHLPLPGACHQAAKTRLDEASFVTPSVEQTPPGGRGPTTTFARGGQQYSYGPRGHTPIPSPHVNRDRDHDNHRAREPQLEHEHDCGDEPGIERYRHARKCEQLERIRQRELNRKCDKRELGLEKQRNRDCVDRKYWGVATDVTEVGEGEVVSVDDAPEPRRTSTRGPLVRRATDEATKLRNINGVFPSTSGDDGAVARRAAAISSHRPKGGKSDQTHAPDKHGLSGGVEVCRKRNAGLVVVNGAAVGKLNKRRRTESDADLKSPASEFVGEVPLAGTRPVVNEAQKVPGISLRKANRILSSREEPSHPLRGHGKVTRSSSWAAGTAAVVAAAPEVVDLEEKDRPASDGDDGSGNDSDGATPVDEEEAAKKKTFWSNVGKKYLTIKFNYEKVAKCIEDFTSLISMEHVVNLGFCGLKTSSFASVIPLLAESGEELFDLGLEHNLLDEFPEEFGELAKSAPLTMLNAEVNSLPRVPRALLQFKKLQFINLSRNKIKEVPPELFQLPEIKSLTLSYNFISTLPTGLGALKRLHLLRLESNFLEALPHDLGTDNPELRIIDVQSNKDFGCGVPAAMLSLANQLDHFFFEETELYRLLPRKVRDGSCQTVLEAVAGKSREFVEIEVCANMGRAPRSRRKSESGGGKAEEKAQLGDSVVDTVENEKAAADQKDEKLASGVASPEQIDGAAAGAGGGPVVLDLSTSRSAALAGTSLDVANFMEGVDDNAELEPKLNRSRSDVRDEVDRSHVPAQNSSAAGDEVLDLVADDEKTGEAVLKDWTSGS